MTYMRQTQTVQMKTLIYKGQFSTVCTLYIMATTVKFQREAHTCMCFVTMWRSQIFKTETTWNKTKINFLWFISLNVITYQKCYGWSNRNVQEYELILKLTFMQYPAMHTNCIISHCTTLQYNHNNISRRNEILNTKNNEFNSAAIFPVWHELPMLRCGQINVTGIRRQQETWK